MKQISLLTVCAFLLAGCLSARQTPATLAPEVTVTWTVSPIPTPTIFPQFLSLQEQIAAHGEMYTLNADGQIEMQTEEGMIIVPDIQVHPDGTMTFTHDEQEFQADPDSLEVSGQTITFKDENGKTWVFDGESLQSEAIARAKADFEKYGYDHTALEFSEDEEGKVIVINPETGEVVYEAGFFALSYIQRTIESTHDIRPGLDPRPEFRSDGTRISWPGRPTDATSAYLVRLFKQEYGDNAFEDKVGFTAILIDRELNGWGLVENPKPDPNDIQYLIFETTDGHLVKVPLVGISQSEVMHFWASR